MTTDSAPFNIKISEVPHKGAENFSYLRKVWDQEKMQLIRICTKKIVVQHWKLCRKWSSFITTMAMICSSLDVLYITWPTFVCTVLPRQIFIHSMKVIKFCFQKIGRYGWRTINSVFLMLLFTRLKSASPQLFVERMLEKMLADFTLTQCVNHFLQYYTQDMSSMQICKNSSPVRKNVEVSKIWSFRTFSESDQTAELRGLTQQVIIIRLIVSMQKDFMDFTRQCLKQWVVSIFTVRVEGQDFL